ncbi:MAG TPA: type II secretion system minor pseudopilin GspH [Steroidobacteraceae bacterium]|nr:type II secretion system minor pseudopilin GspH [Steroidobacteraceae bacterium]
MRLRARGFSLIEIMVVVFIIGLISAAVVIKFAGNNRDTALDQEAERLDALFDYVREQAELQTRDFGFRASDHGYSFVVFDVLANQWRPVEEDDALRDRELPEGLEPHMVVEGRSIVLDREKKNLKDFQPQILIFANGDLSSFEISLQREGVEQGARLYTDEQSDIRLLLPGQVAEKTPVTSKVAAK